MYISKELLDKPESEDVDAVLQIASRANRKLFDKVKKEDKGMYSALENIFFIYKAF